MLQEIKAKSGLTRSLVDAIQSGLTINDVKGIFKALADMKLFKQRLYKLNK